MHVKTDRRERFECLRDLCRIGDLLETDDATISHCPNVREARFEGSARRYRPRRVCTEGEDSSRKQLLDSVKIIADGSI